MFALAALPTSPLVIEVAYSLFVTVLHSYPSSLPREGLVTAEPESPRG